ncbi:acyltransferase [Candidatus Saccharibacteria bacterium]|nr:acyltransferase [Candidatus Saccharibacteria bacterium]
MKNSPAKVRQSGLELLRIIAMIFIVASHLSQRGNWSWIITDIPLSFNQFFMNIVICFGQVGVAIFFTITGYFLYNSKNYNWKRIFKILRPTWFYSFTFLFLALLFFPSLINFSLPLNQSTAHLIFPVTTNAYWFISAYISLYLLLPYLKIWLDNLNSKKLLRLILIVAGIFIIPNFLSYFVADTSSFILAIPSAIFYTIVGYTIHRYKNNLLQLKNNKLLLISLSGIILYVISSLLIHFATTRLNYTNINNNILIDTMSLPCMLTSVPLVIFFSRLKFINKFINYIAGLVFGIYLVHSNSIFIDVIWRQQDLLRTFIASNYSPIHFILYFISTTIIIFCISAIIEASRKLLTKIISKLFYNLCYLFRFHLHKKSSHTQ